MGALTPNQASGNPTLDTWVDQWGKKISGIFNEFFKAQKRLEDALMSEFKGNFPNLDALDDCEVALYSTQSKLTTIINQTQNILDNPPSPNTWQIPFFTAQQARQQTMKTQIDAAIHVCTGANWMTQANAGNLQESLWNAGSNKNFRLASTEFAKQYVAISADINTQVTATN